MSQSASTPDEVPPPGSACAAHRNEPVLAGAETLLVRLRDRLEHEERLLIGFSGGADSALLAAAASSVLGDRAVAVTAVSPSLPEHERRAALSFARQHGIRHLQVYTDELDRPEYVRNSGDRCFHCKSALFDALAPIAALTGSRIALGTNLDDLGDYRPGQRAARERGAVFPLVDAGLGKDAVRAVSKLLSLETADKPAAACLSSRIAYGDPVTAEVLGRIERAEAALHRRGFTECRVRAHANGSVARLEIPAERLPDVHLVREGLVEEVRAAGFTFVALDLAGFRSGSMNVLLSRPQRRVR